MNHSSKPNLQQMFWISPKLETQVGSITSIGFIASIRLIGSVSLIQQFLH